MTVKIDVDGVIRDIISAMCGLYNERFGGNMCIEDVDDYDINNGFPSVLEETGTDPVRYFFTDHAEEIFETVSKPFDGVKESIDRLRGRGIKVVIVTWQFTLKNIKHTLDFLEMHGIKYDDICFTRDKWIINGDYLIDDNPEFILDERDKSKKIIVDTPYNRYVSNKYVRVKSLKEAVDYIIDKENKEREAA